MLNSGTSLKALLLSIISALVLASTKIPQQEENPIALELSSEETYTERLVRGLQNEPNNSVDEESLADDVVATTRDPLENIGEPVNSGTDEAEGTGTGVDPEQTEPVPSNDVTDNTPDTDPNTDPGSTPGDADVGGDTDDPWADGAADPATEDRDDTVGDDGTSTPIDDPPTDGAVDGDEETEGQASTDPADPATDPVVNDDPIENEEAADDQTGTVDEETTDDDSAVDDRIGSQDDEDDQATDEDPAT